MTEWAPSRWRLRVSPFHRSGQHRFILVHLCFPKCPTVSPNRWEFTIEMAPRDPAGIRLELGSAQGAVFLVWYVSSVEAGAAVDLRVEVVPGWWDSVGSV